ncbi:hypothetical protein [Shimazuella alba]|uniref:Uncharacterized protein n=1 Tax=Shimazuella alba TaxID=2690964 RepID=A0A6I4VWQ5_9BACL|nr:hypothetical protein [Shimazuella alba]MXQ54465.1 hypothetical protein [Shimazuella alba]
MAKSVEAQYAEKLRDQLGDEFEVKTENGEVKITRRKPEISHRVSKITRADLEPKRIAKDADHIREALGK